MGREDPLEEGTTTHSSILAWRILWNEEPGGLQSIGLHRVGHNAKWLSRLQSLCKPGMTSQTMGIQTWARQGRQSAESEEQAGDEGSRCPGQSLNHSWHVPWVHGLGYQADGLDFFFLYNFDMLDIFICSEVNLLKASSSLLRSLSHSTDEETKAQTGQGLNQGHKANKCKNQGLNPFPCESSTSVLCFLGLCPAEKEVQSPGWITAFERPRNHCFHGLWPP